MPFHLYIYLISCPGFFSFIVPRTFWFEAAAIRSIFEACLTLSRWSNKFPAEGDYAFCGPSPYQRALLSPHSLQVFFSYTQKHLIFYLRCIQERRSGISIVFAILLPQILDDMSCHLKICCEAVSSPHGRSILSHLGWVFPFHGILAVDFQENRREADTETDHGLRLHWQTAEYTFNRGRRWNTRGPSYTTGKKNLEECSLILLGRFLTTRRYNLRAAKAMLRNAWKLGNDVRIIDVGEGVLQFKFKLESQLQWVQKNGSSSFENHLLVLRRWERGMTVRSITFSVLPI